jgi:hypothetical protein
MLTILEVLFIVAILIVGFIAFQAHQKHNAFAVQAKSDLQEAKDRISTLEDKLLHRAPVVSADPAAPAPVQAQQ